MNVVHVYRTYFPDPPGGLQEAIRQIAMATRCYGVDVRIFALSPTPEPTCVERDEGRVVRARSWAAPASCDLGGIGALQRYRELVDWADVVHFHFPWPFADVLHLLGRTCKPAVMTYHSDIVRQKLLGAVYGPLMRRTLKAMSAIVATSPAYTRTSPVLTSAAVSARQLHTIPLGISDYRDAPRGLALERPELAALTGKPFVLALGVLRYYKGFHTLIDAAAQIDAPIVIAGAGPEWGNLHAQAERLGARNVTFVGQVSDDEKIALLEGCRVLVLPSHLRSEAFGMVLVEAQMFGKPTVCCEMGSGTSYVNEDGVTGYVVAPERPAALAAAVSRLLADDALAARMGGAARVRYERLFSGDALGQAYSELYEQVWR